MPDDEIMPLRFVMFKALCVEQWPPRTAFTEAWLTTHRPPHVSVDGDVVTVTAHNGISTYRLRRDLPRFGGGIVADLETGDTPSRLAQRRAKYERPAGTDLDERGEG
jgi:hypothetical protein